MADNKLSGVRAFFRRFWGAKPISQGRVVHGEHAPAAVGAVEMSPAKSTNLDVMFKEGLRHHQRGDIAKAQKHYQDILERAPAHFDARFILGIIAIQEKDFRLAIDHLNIASASNPSSVDVHCAMGDAFAAVCRYSEALASYKRALELEPDNVDVLINQAPLLYRLGRNADALESVERALQYRSDSINALILRGNILSALGRPRDAQCSFDQALQLDENNAEALNNRGVALSTLGHTQEAMQSYERALDVNPRFVGALNNKALAFSGMGRYEDAAVYYRRALEIEPGNPDALYNLGLVSLLKGDFVEGWRLYETRWKIEQFRAFQRSFSAPSWRGTEPIVGKTILLNAEQGLGDTIQFCRYVNSLAHEGARVIFEAPAALKMLLSGMDGVAQIITQSESEVRCDFCCPLLSLPFAFQTTANNIPNAVPYIFAEHSRIELWRKRLSESSKAKIGLAWSGNPGHRNDRNRSLPFSILAPLLAHDADFVSLQKDIRDSDKAELQKFGDIARLGEEFIDFSDTAALIECLDLIITVDTAVAHLAGAMAKPVWILLPFDPDWRWMLGRNDSPWYPTARLFRQERVGDWRGVMGQVEVALLKLLA